MLSKIFAALLLVFLAIVAMRLAIAGLEVVVAMLPLALVLLAVYVACRVLFKLDLLKWAKDRWNQAS